MTAAYRETLNGRLLMITTAALELGFSLDDGGVRILRRVGEPNLAGHGADRAGVDVALGNRGWLSSYAFARYLAHQIDSDGDAVDIVITIGLGPLKLYDRYRIVATLITRRLSIENVTDEEVMLRGARLIVPWLRVGSDETCVFEAPGNSVRPRIPLAVAGAQREGVLPRRFFAPGLRDGRGLEPATGFGPGLMALYDRATHDAVLCWCRSATETFLPQIEGNDIAVSLIHQIAIADRLDAATAVSCGTQYLLLAREPWPELLGIYRRTWEEPAVADQNAGMQQSAPVLYEVHPAQLGGLSGLCERLEALRDMGVTTICLLPIWPFGRRSEILWDGNWSSRDPYAVFDMTHIDPTIGGSEGLRTLVAGAHAAGLQVLLDLPWIGCAVDSPLLNDHPDWFCYDEHELAARITPADQIVAYDWANTELRNTMVAAACTMLREYALDGFRPVVARSVPPNWSPRLLHHASAGTQGYLQAIEQLRAEMHNIRPDALLIADRGGPAVLMLHNMAIDELAHHMFIHTAISRMTPTELGTWLSDQRSVLPAGAARICFTESSQTRLINPLADGLRGSRISRMLLAGMIFCGYVPQIRCGQEEGEELMLTKLLAARRSTPALIDGDVLYNMVHCNNPQIFIVLRTHGDSFVVAMLNISPNRQSTTITLPIERLRLAETSYELEDLLDGLSFEDDAGVLRTRDELRVLTFSIDPYSAACFVARPVADHLPD
ncbi:MAG TPA: alpha-amylase family glycosyl hydrolase [Roseiflexaceae bacterium]|nr:alpha-amylase family glycosyl hydrolase [Roseiflexaceae bacterium]